MGSDQEDVFAETVEVTQASDTIIHSTENVGWQIDYIYLI